MLIVLPCKTQPKSTEKWCEFVWKDLEHERTQLIYQLTNNSNSPFTSEMTGVHRVAYQDKSNIWMTRQEQTPHALKQPFHMQILYQYQDSTLHEYADRS
jgi:hypothetical protein